MRELNASGWPLKYLIIIMIDYRCQKMVNSTPPFNPQIWISDWHDTSVQMQRLTFNQLLDLSIQLLRE